MWDEFKNQRAALGAPEGRELLESSELGDLLLWISERVHMKKLAGEEMIAGEKSKKTEDMRPAQRRGVGMVGKSGV